MSVTLTLWRSQGESMAIEVIGPGSLTGNKRGRTYQPEVDKYHVLDPSMNAGDLLTLLMAQGVKVEMPVLLNGRHCIMYRIDPLSEVLELFTHTTRV